MKKLIACILVFVLCMGLTPIGAHAAFGDITDPAVQEAASLLQSLRLVDGYKDGLFHPSDKLTRAQFCKLAMLLSGIDNATAYSGVTIFPDVRASHWAQGYINAAVRDKKIIAGFPDGTFRPDAPISFAQAVTMLMRLLGYEDKDVGTNWPNSYLQKASSIELTKSLSLKQNDAVSRAYGVRLFYNALFVKGKEGDLLITKLGVTEAKVIVIDVEGKSPDGLTSGLVTVGGDGFYPYKNKPAVESGSRGTLRLDKEGYVLTWTPETQTKKSFLVKTSDAQSITGTSGEKIDRIPATAIVYLNGEAQTWKDIWVDIKPGQQVRCYYGKTGAIDYLLLEDVRMTGRVEVLSAAPKAGENPLLRLGASNTALVYKNGVLASWTDLRQWDVLVIDPAANTVSASNFRIVGIFESADPFREAPDQVTTLGGHKYPVLPDARAKLGTYRYGQALTFLFTQDLRVADVQPSTQLNATQPGLLTAVDTVTLWNGVTIKGTNANESLKEGTLVMVSQPIANRLMMTPISDGGSTQLDLGTMKAGAKNNDIASYAVFYDRCGPGGRAVQVKKETLPTTLSSMQVLTVRHDTNGCADVIVLNNVTGNAWLYGNIAWSSPVTKPGEDKPDPGSDPVVIDSTPTDGSLKVTTQNGTAELVCPASVTPPAPSGLFAVAVGTNGKVIAIKRLTSVTGLHRVDFSGDTRLTVSGHELVLPEDMKVFVNDIAGFMTVGEARRYTNDFTVFLDRPVAEGGQIRYIVGL